MLLGAIKRAMKWRVEGYTLSVLVNGVGFLLLGMWAAVIAATGAGWDSLAGPLTAVCIVFGAFVILNESYKASHRRSRDLT